MTLTTAVSLAVATFIFVMTPGPGVMAIVAKTLSAGFWTGAVLGFGLLLGDMIYLVAALASLHAFAEALIPVMTLVRLFGGLYLAWLGVQIFRAPPPEIKDQGVIGQRRNLLLTGILISGSNPKVIIFYLSFLPLFVDMNALDLTQSLMVIAIIASMLILGVFITTIMSYQIKRMVRSEAGGKRLNQICGVLMVIVGAGLIATI